MLWNHRFAPQSLLLRFAPIQLATGLVGRRPAPIDFFHSLLHAGQILSGVIDEEKKDQVEAAEKRPYTGSGQCDGTDAGLRSAG